MVLDNPRIHPGEVINILFAWPPQEDYVYSKCVYGEVMSRLYTSQFS